MIDIYKASAGSGKTFTLSKTYRDFLLKAGTDDAYRHILAVTFTNKATEEMKDRILRDLAQSKDPRAQKILIKLLHDYGAFSVSTIDRFFQQALRAFTKELGHSSNYQIELDKDSLMTEALDRIMDDLTPQDTTLLDWFNREISSQLAEGDKPSIEDSLHDMAGLFGKAVDIYGKNGFNLNRQTISQIQKDCAKIIADYIKDVNDSGHGITLIDGQVKNMRWVRPAVLRLSTWDGKDESKIVLSLTVAAELNRLGYEDTVDLVAVSLPRFKAYKTAVTILNTTFVLGIANEFFQKLKELEDEKNVLCLDQTTALLRDIIDGSDAPFVYEKLGVRYNNFLLDEFQDTSNTQWDNFKPLLENSVSQNHGNIIVGDVKQSIYRFRGSDWKLLNNEISDTFPGSTRGHNLQDNWRSDRAIVDFNNDFFVKASNYLDKKELYNDVIQNVKKEDFPGYVTTDFCVDRESILEKTLEYVEQAIANGARPCDIAILVRAKAEGSEVANMLISKEYGVVSDDSLLLSSSSVVRQAVSVLQAIANPDNILETYTCKSLNISLDKSYHSLVDLCDRIFMALKANDPEIFRGQTLFVQSFMDAVQNWTGLYGNKLKAFLKYWDENKENLLINSPEDSDSIRITTVHKSKGLAYPVVIFPFANKVTLYKENKQWCSLNEGEFLGGKYDGLSFPISLSKSLENSYFSKALDAETDMQIVDNLNIFYVCLTRAKHQMHIIAKEPYKSFIEGKSAASSISDILYNTHKDIRLGEPCDFSQINTESDNKIRDFSADYDSFPMNPKGKKERLALSPQAWDFFSEEGIGNSKRLDGIRLHDILSRIKNTDDMERVLQYQDAETATFLKARIESQKQWFDPSLKVLNETAIITKTGETCRPDRVLIDPSGKVVVIDFKFGGEHKGYRDQVALYMQQYKELGYGDVAGFLWYVTENKVVKI